MKQWRRAILNYETTHPSRLISARRSFNAHRRLRLQGGGGNTCPVQYSPLQQTITFTEKCTLPANIFKPLTKSKKHLHKNGPYEQHKTGGNEKMIHFIVEPLNRTPPEFDTFFDLLLEYSNIRMYSQLQTTYDTLYLLNERCHESKDECVEYLEHAKEISDTQLQTNNINVDIFRSYIEAKNKSIQDS